MSYTPVEEEDPNLCCNVLGPWGHLLSEIRDKCSMQPLYMEYLEIESQMVVARCPGEEERQRELFNGSTFSFATWKAFRDYCTTSML